jgi:predicted ribosome quality control (RQC) complex YloA/Tae2 family protein
LTFALCAFIFAFLPWLPALQPVDLTTLTAICSDLRSRWLPARLEQVYQRDRFTLYLALRTLDRRGWLTLSWHPQAARLSMSDPPPRTFSQQIRHQVGGLALTEIEPIAPWERAIDLRFARRPGEPALWHLYVEIMGKYSNVILANQENQIVTAAHQVSSQQSSVRPIQTGQPYEIPPALTDPAPSLKEPLERWQERLNLVPGTLKRNLLKNYRGLSSALVISMLQAADLEPEQLTDSLTSTDWHRLFEYWQHWLGVLQNGTFEPGWSESGYTVMGWGRVQSVASIQELIDRYYTDHLNHQEFAQLKHRLVQKLSTVLGKLQIKAEVFRTRLSQSDRAEVYRERADLLMAHLHEWKPGMKAIVLADFETGASVSISLDPEKNAVQNAQALYKQHQKLKRARHAVEPLLTEVTTEIQYLEQVEAALEELTDYRTSEDLRALEEIRDELIQQQYLEDSGYRIRTDNSRDDDVSQPYRYHTPHGLEVLVGRNNRQNDQLTFRTAGDYDLWFHTQEIAGSHVLLRLTPGAVPEDADLQFVADLAAFHSRARQSEQVPVIYTEPKHVFKPKGAKPGMTVYKHERVIWGQPQRGKNGVEKSDALTKK